MANAAAAYRTGPRSCCLLPVILTCPDALLAVACTLEFAHVAVGVDCAQEHWLELVHASIGEQQGGVVQGHLHSNSKCATCRTSRDLLGPVQHGDLASCK